MTDAVGAHDASSRHARRNAGLQPASAPASYTATGTLLDTLRVAVVMLDTSGRIVLWSPPAEEMLGWAGEHVVGRRVGAFLDTRDPADGFAQGKQVRAATVPVPGAGERILAQLLRIGRWNGILPLRHRDGRTVQVEARASLLVDGDGKPFVLASFAETSTVRTVEHDLAVLDSLFDTSPLGVGVFDTQLRFVRVNEALARMNNLPMEAHLGRTVKEILDEPTAQELTILQQNVLRTGVPVVDLTTLASGGGGYRSVSYHRLEDRSGKVLGISCTVMDATDRHAAAANVERARHRLVLLNDIGARLAVHLEVPRMAQELAEAVVPRFSDYAGVILLQDVVRGGDLPRTPHTRFTPLVQLGAAAAEDSIAAERMLGLGERMAFSEESIFECVLHTGLPQLVDSREALADTTFPGDPRVQIAMDLGIHSLMVLPLRARGIVLGLLVISRAGSREPFDRDDLQLAMEIADRAGGSLDNARLYAREREGALMLQRSLLPQTVPKPLGVQLAFRYVPGSSGTEVGGDWFDVIALAGGRVAFVVGDVMGHGLRAAATMGRLSTAVRTLAQLDLPPAKLLSHINDLADDLAHGPDEPLMATCVYAVYDPATRKVCVAKAGHVPPLIVEPGLNGKVRQVEMPSGAPLGVGGVDFEGVEFEVSDGAVLVLYSDGLVENRGEDISAGIDRLIGVLNRRHADLEDACDDILARLEPGHEPDDVAVVMARLGGLPQGTASAWTFTADPTVVSRARRLVRQTLREWELTALDDTTVLLVSELITNSLRYARGPIGLRMVRGSSLLVEVSDPLPDPPLERLVDTTDEGGRGLQLVAHSSRRWGTRHTPNGKVVWFELALPGS
ncbi:SpoIIE family protein phosphatase [Wenjunlia tyrosinilytica]|uniref:protein-serine/threonine phosphatase n=1 Tax=Wenjunlia tyrosinilytica TaxID=1544741 RepID=A0A918E1X5_9ACTN|nr:SpoIIE family protein phosphatase [Wenjunlia tyrosinilytica]GGO97708.1 hypothetical protein GCM10012280_60160 [Wenjunlia tyrosinilytica]